MDGFGDKMILFSSSVILSCDMIFILSVSSFIAAAAGSSILKLNCVANRMARIIRSGSSENVSTGLSGVRISLFSRSVSPLKGSSKFTECIWM